MNDLPLNALRAFAAVYKHGGVRAAARELGSAHSSVSRHLSELDAWLGVPLLHPTAGRRPLTFTAQGECLGRALLSGLGEITQAVAAVRESRSAQAVTLSTAPSFAMRWLLPRLPELERAHPQIELSVLVDQRLDALQDGRIDLSIRMGAGPWPDLRCESLMDEHICPVMSPALWESSGRPQQPAQLARMRLLHDRDPQTTWETWRQSYGPADLNVRSGPRFASSDLLLRAATQGHGVALMRHRLAADEIAAGILLKPFGSHYVRLEHAYWIVMPRQDQIRPAVKTLIDWLRWQASIQRMK
ncbi:MAG: LysR substrate-binding domain-containing protein [Luteibacter sp.]